MKWRDLAWIPAPIARTEWSTSHAQLPVAIPRGGDEYRILVACRDSQQRSSVGWVDIDLREPSRVQRVAAQPVLTPGSLGNADDHGIYPSCIATCGDALYLYTIGWNPGVRRPLFYSTIGLAISHDGGNSFTRYSPAPIMARSAHDPCLVTGPCVRKAGGTWHMWYVSGFRWEEIENELRSFYHIKIATSEDGVEWRRDGIVAIDLLGDETNISRPTVSEIDGVLHMWFSVASGGDYRLGHAASKDGVRWQRDSSLVDFGAIRKSTAPVFAYPHVFRHRGDCYMLYNGAGFGRDGFGIAILE